MTEHTPTPWQIKGADRNLAVWGSDGFYVCGKLANWSETEATGRANAEFIVRAVNSYDDMLAALKAAEAMIDSMSRAAFRTGLEGTSDWDKVAGGADIYGTLDTIRDAIANAEARAEGATHG